jgi:iron complex transport system substrate-binding protein
MAHRLALDLDLAGGDRAAGAGGLGVVRWLVIVAAALGSAVAAAAERPRIVSLAPNLTEIAYAAGAGPALVGTVEYSDYPAAARQLPRVGDGWRIDYEQVLALRPDVVLAWTSGTPTQTIERLRALGLRVVAVPTFRLADVPAALRLVGDLAGSRRQADAAAAQFDAEVQRLRREHARALPVRVFIAIDDAPLFTVNGDHIISEVVDLCGGRNVFAELPQIAPQVDVEAVLASDPDVILSTDDTIADPRAQWLAWPKLRAVRFGTIYALPSDTVTRAAPRLADGAAEVCAALDSARGKLSAAR